MDMGQPEDQGPTEAWFDLPVVDTPPPPRRSRFRWIVAGVVLVAGAGAAAFFLLQGSGKDFPSKWDERLTDLIAFVEDERGLEFEHPVEIDYLDEEEWAEHAKVDEEDELSDEDRELLEHGAGMFRALGLAEGELDLLKSSEQLSASATVGAYDLEDENIVIRGTELTLNVKATLVHELTHVLQDQHFDIGDRLAQLDEDDDESTNPEASLGVLVEGDADRIEDRWRDSLSSAERAELAKQERAGGDDAEEGLEEVPASIVTFFASKYILGGGFVGVLEADGGDHAIDRAFETSPGPEEHVLNPLAYLRGDLPTEVDPPSVDGKLIKDLDGEFGALGLFVTLAERIDPTAALAAVDGWGGDAFVGYTADDRTCVAVHIAGEDADAAEALHAVITKWAEAMPPEASVVVGRDGEVVVFTTCDPGTDADLIDGDGRSRDVIGVPATRNELARQVLDAGGTSDNASCFANAVVANVPYEVLIADDVTEAQQAELQRIAAEQGMACR